MKMVEKVAKAIGCLDFDRCAHSRTDKAGSCEDCFRAARAAIEAMREPTPEMLQAAHDLLSGSEEPELVWPAMLDAALRE